MPPYLATALILVFGVMLNSRRILQGADTQGWAYASGWAFAAIVVPFLLAAIIAAAVQFMRPKPGGFQSRLNVIALVLITITGLLNLRGAPAETAVRMQHDTQPPVAMHNTSV